MAKHIRRVHSLALRKEWMKSFGSYLRKKRRIKGITQRQLAHELGIDHTIVCHIETARKHVTREMAADIGELFDEPQTAMAAAGYIPFVGWKP